jgi:predicted GNAT family acetyltransferase
MSDMLVKLYDFTVDLTVFEKLRTEGIEIKRALAPDKRLVADWVCHNFGECWASECEVAFANHPVSCYVAVKSGEIIGFACYEATARDYFGPTGVAEAFRGKGAGAALLYSCLNSLKELGYAYAIIGSAGPVDYYRKTVGAIIIEDSEPGIYKNLIR